MTHINDKIEVELKSDNLTDYGFIMVLKIDHENRFQNIDAWDMPSSIILCEDNDILDQSMSIDSISTSLNRTRDVSRVQCSTPRKSTSNPPAVLDDVQPDENHPSLPSEDFDQSQPDPISTLSPSTKRKSVDIDPDDQWEDTVKQKFNFLSSTFLQYFKRRHKKSARFRTGQTFMKQKYRAIYKQIHNDVEENELFKASLCYLTHYAKDRGITIVQLFSILSMIYLKSFVYKDNLSRKKSENPGLIKCLKTSDSEPVSRNTNKKLTSSLGSVCRLIGPAFNHDKLTQIDREKISMGLFAKGKLTVSRYRHQYEWLKLHGQHHLMLPWTNIHNNRIVNKYTGTIEPLFIKKPNPHYNSISNPIPHLKIQLGAYMPLTSMKNIFLPGYLKHVEIVCSAGFKYPDIYIMAKYGDDGFKTSREGSGVKYEHRTHETSHSTTKNVDILNGVVGIVQIHFGEKSEEFDDNPSLNNFNSCKVFHAQSNNPHQCFTIYLSYNTPENAVTVQSLFEVEDIKFYMTQSCTSFSYESSQRKHNVFFQPFGRMFDGKQQHIRNNTNNKACNMGDCSDLLETGIPRTTELFQGVLAKVGPVDVQTYKWDKKTLDKTVKDRHGFLGEHCVEDAIEQMSGLLGVLHTKLRLFNHLAMDLAVNLHDHVAEFPKTFFKLHDCNQRGCAEIKDCHKLGFYERKNQRRKATQWEYSVFFKNHPTIKLIVDHIVGGNLGTVC